MWCCNKQWHCNKTKFVRCYNKCKDHTNEKIIMLKQNENARKWVKKKEKDCNKIDLQVQCKRLLVIIDVDVGCNSKKLKEKTLVTLSQRKILFVGTK